MSVCITILLVNLIYIFGNIPLDLYDYLAYCLKTVTIRLSSFTIIYCPPIPLAKYVFLLHHCHHLISTNDTRTTTSFLVFVSPRFQNLFCRFSWPLAGVRLALKFTINHYVTLSSSGNLDFFEDNNVVQIVEITGFR